jgi:S-DNA-T family DNA segregation ATPase FtsK/SpoIIIE
MVSLLYDGPQVWAYAVSLGLGEDPRRVEALGPALAMAAGADSARVARDAGRLVIEVPKPPDKRAVLRPDRLEALTAPSVTAVPLGLATGGRPVWFDLADERTCHVIIGGTTGSGKTVTLHWLLTRLLLQNGPDTLRVLALDPKRGELAPFAHVPHLLHPITSNPLDVARVLTWVEGELDRRAATNTRRPRLVVILEEVADVLKTTPTAGDLLARIAQIGRALGVHLVATTQQPGARSLGDALANFPARLLGRVASATLTYGAAGRARTMADQLLGRGDFLLITADGTTRLQVPMITGRQYRSLPRADQVDTLDSDLPSVALFADLARDSRGGQGRRELGPAEYARIDQALADGATADDLRGEFGIGWDRARRLQAGYRERGNG